MLVMLRLKGKYLEVPYIILFIFCFKMYEKKFKVLPAKRTPCTEGSGSKYQLLLKGTSFFRKWLLSSLRGRKLQGEPGTACTRERRGK